MPARLGGQVDSRRPLDLNQLTLELVLDLFLTLLVDEIPLVGDDDECASRVDDLLDDAHILLRQGSRAIDEHQGDLGLLDRGLGADGGVVVGAGRPVHLAADTRGVDEPPRAAIELNELIDGVTSGAGELVDDDALAAGQRVQQGRLANVGATDEGDATRTAGRQRRGNGRLGREDLHDDVQEIAGATSMQGGNGVGLAQAKAPQVGSVGLLQGRVHLVSGQDDRLLLGAQHLHDALVRGGDADGRIQDEDDSVSQINGDLCLLGDGTIQTLDVDLPAAGVDEREVASRPFGGVGDAIAGHAGRVLHDRLAPTKDAVDQRGLADVRPADDCEHGQTRSHVVRFRERRLAGQERQVLLVQIELVEVGAHETGTRLGLLVAQFDCGGRALHRISDVVFGRVRVECGGRVGLVIKVIHPPSLRRGAP